MQDKFQKILDKAIEHITMPREYDPDATMYICGHPVDDILESRHLQSKLYNHYFPPTITINTIKTIGIEDIRSRE